MAKSYTYPRTTVEVEALRHSNIQPGAEDTTVLFVPLITKKGPDKTVTPVHTLNEFISIFGELDYDVNGQMALNVYNWLINGGTVYVYRIPNVKAGAEKALIKTGNEPEERTALEGSVELLSANADPSVLTEDAWRLDGNTLYFYSATPGANDNVFYSGNLEADAEGNFAPATKEVSSGDDEDETESVAYPTFAYVVGYVQSTTATLNDVTFIPSEAEGAENLRCSVLVAVDTDDNNTVYKINGTRLENSEEEAEAEDAVKTLGVAKYTGEYYNDMRLTVTPISEEYFNLAVKVVDKRTNIPVIVEQYYKLNVKTYRAALVASEYVGSFDIEDLLTDGKFVADGETRGRKFYNDIELVCEGAEADPSKAKDTDCLADFWTNVTEDESCYPLLNDLETPIDLLIDAGYSADLKAKMAKFVDEVRPDIVLLLDEVVLTDRLEVPEAIDGSSIEGIERFSGTKVAIWDQYFTVYDATFTNQNIYVGPSYFLSKLIPYNDGVYGIQFPTAGLRRGILDDALAVNENPTPDKKQTNFEDRINYCEKTSREYAFMNQRMYDGSNEAQYTALSFLNNIRVVERMKKDIKRIGRQYLFEFNDAATLTQLNTVLNRYVTNWISNRTLATGSVTVAKNPFSDEAVDVSLTIKFNGTIEVITVNITVE